MDNNYATHLAQLAQVYEMLKNLRDRTENVDDVFDEVLGHMSEMRKLKAENEALREALNKIIKHSECLQKMPPVQGDPQREIFSEGFKVGWAESAEMAEKALANHDKEGE